ncbi:MAG: single-stranded DNA-binding protein [bacterium]|nr:single-stranded DNA-binding protein [bacterium]
MNLNKVFLIGNLTRNPELRALPSGAAVASFGIATNRIWKNQQGERQEDVQFHNVVVFGRQAEIVNQYLTKGSLALIEGRIQTSSWDGKDGTKQYKTEIVAERVQFGPRSAAKQEGFVKNETPKVVNQNPPIREELPEINIDEGEIRPEDLPF